MPEINTVLQPLTICGLPTSGKGVLGLLLNGCPEIYSLPMWHDAISSLLVLFPQELENCRACGMGRMHDTHDLVNQAFVLRQLLTLHSDYYLRLELLEKRKCFIFHLGHDRFEKVPVAFDLDFFRLDSHIMREVFNAAEPSPINIFNIIFKNLMRETGAPGRVKYCLSISKNNLTDYEALVDAYPGGKVIFVARDIIEALGSTVLRASSLDGAGRSFAFALRDNLAANFGKSYSRQHEKAKRMAREYPDRFLIVDFEDLFNNLERTMRGICRFLEVDFQEAALKATFGGRDLSPAVLGAGVQDSMKAKLSADDYKLLKKSVATYAENQYEDSSSRVFFHPLMFRSNFPVRDGALVLRRPAAGDDHLFFGPYMRVPEGSWEATFLFDRPSSGGPKLFIDCVDGADKTYFSDHIGRSSRGGAYRLEVGGGDVKFEFRAYWRGGEDREILFRGVVLERVSGPRRAARSRPALFYKRLKKAWRAFRHG